MGYPLLAETLPKKSRNYWIDPPRSWTSRLSFVRLQSGDAWSSLCGSPALCKQCLLSTTMNFAIHTSTLHLTRVQPGLLLCHWAQCCNFRLLQRFVPVLAFSHSDTRACPRRKAFGDGLFPPTVSTFHCAKRPALLTANVWRSPLATCHVCDKGIAFITAPKASASVLEMLHASGWTGSLHVPAHNVFALGESGVTSLHPGWVVNFSWGTW